MQGRIKEALEVAGVDLEVVMATPGFMLAAAQASPVVATVPRRIAERNGPLLGLEVSPLPFALSLPPVNMVWATHADSDPANAWLRQQVRDGLAGTATPMAPSCPCSLSAASGAVTPRSGGWSETLGVHVWKVPDAQDRALTSLSRMRSWLSLRVRWSPAGR